jgi:hypothetical protein
MPATKRVTVTILLEPRYRDVLKERASLQQRSVTRYLERLIKIHLRNTRPLKEDLELFSDEEIDNWKEQREKVPA